MIRTCIFSKNTTEVKLQFPLLLFSRLLLVVKWYLETKNWVYMCSLLPDITASRPFLWTESGNTQFLKNEFTLVLSIHIPHHRVLPYLFPFLICISLLYNKNTISKQYQYITHLPYPKTVSKLTPIPLPITNPKSSFSFIALFVLTISLKSVKVT